MHDKVLLVSGAPVDSARLDRVLYSPVRELTTVLEVFARADPLAAIEAALCRFAPTRIVLAGPDARRDLTGEIEDRFGRPVMTVAARA
jgi:hypothetical protein